MRDNHLLQHIGLQCPSAGRDSMEKSSQNKKQKLQLFVRKAGIALLLGASIFALSACSNVTAELFRLIKITETSGSVSVERKSDTIDAYADMNMEAGDLMQTGSKSFSRMLMDDTTYALVEADSTLSFVADGKGKDAGIKVNLQKGGIFTEFTEGLGSFPSYAVETPNVLAAVRGTVFYVREYEEGTKRISRITVVEGTVEATLRDAEGNMTDDIVEIPAGKEAIIVNDGSGPTFEVRDQDIDYAAIPKELVDYIKVRIGEGTSDDMKYFFRDACLKDAKDLASEEKYDESLTIYDTIIEVLPDDSVMRDSVSETVSDYKDKLVEEKRFGTAQELLDKYEPYADNIDYITVRADIADLREKDAVVRTFMQTVYDTMMAEDYDALVEIYDSEEIGEIIDEIKSMGDDRYVFFLDAEGERTGKAVGIYTYRYPDDREKTWIDRYYLYAGDYVDYKREGEGKDYSTIEGGGYTMKSGVCKNDAPEGRWDYYSVRSRVYNHDINDYEYDKSSTGYETYSAGILNGPWEVSTINARGVELKVSGNYVNGAPEADISEEFAEYYCDFKGWSKKSWDELKEDIAANESGYIYAYTETSDGYMWWWIAVKGDIDGYREFSTYAPRDF